MVEFLVYQFLQWLNEPDTISRGSVVEAARGSGSTAAERMRRRVSHQNGARLRNEADDSRAAILREAARKAVLAAFFNNLAVNALTAAGATPIVAYALSYGTAEGAPLAAVGTVFFLCLLCGVSLVYVASQFRRDADILRAEIDD